MAYISGPFTITAKIGEGSAVSIGGTEEGIEILETPEVEDIISDEYGRVPVDGVNLGIISRIRFTQIDYAATKAAMYAAYTQGDPKAKVGHLVTASAVEIVATPVAGTTAAAESGAITFHKCVIEGDFSVLLSSRHRKGPLTFKLYPGASNKTYTVAAVA